MVRQSTVYSMLAIFMFLSCESFKQPTRIVSPDHFQNNPWDQPSTITGIVEFEGSEARLELIPVTNEATIPTRINSASKDGKFRIPMVISGKYRLRVWAKDYWVHAQSIDIKSGETLSLRIKLKHLPHQQPLLQ